VNQFRYNYGNPKRDSARQAVTLFRDVAPWSLVIMAQAEGKQEEIT
jgi:hypothetical protein